MAIELVYDNDKIKLNQDEFTKQSFKDYVNTGLFFEWLKNENCNISMNEEQEINTDESQDSKRFKTFLFKINPIDNLKININSNIHFAIGQPNTGKSYKFEESKVFDISYKNHYKYLKIPVSGGIGNEYKGLQNTDLAITYDPIKKEIRFGEFLQVLMSAIVNSKVPHVVFLDDFHNQDISSLLSEYTPLFKAQQKRDLKETEPSHEIFKLYFDSIEEFIDKWNLFIDENFKELPIVAITNRISGSSLKLVYPSNFYILGAANFNQNSLNIFADWEDRAEIKYKDPIKDFLNTSMYNEIKDDAFVKCCLKLNTELKKLLISEKIFDIEKYCFGMWKVFDFNQELVKDKKEQVKIIKFFFRMIKNSLKFNNKNSLINFVGENLFKQMQEDDWFKTNIEDISKIHENQDIREILHKYNIYEENI